MNQAVRLNPFSRRRMLSHALWKKGGGVDLLNSPNFLGLTDAHAQYKLYLLCSRTGVEKTQYLGIIFVRRCGVLWCWRKWTWWIQVRELLSFFLSLASLADGECIALWNPVLVPVSVESDSYGIAFLRGTRETQRRRCRHSWIRLLALRTKQSPVAGLETIGVPTRLSAWG